MLRKIISSNKGMTLAEMLIVVAVTIAVGLTSASYIGADIKLKSSQYGNDLSNLTVNAPTVTSSTSGTYTINSRGSTGMPATINFQ
jgi:hypothetical protein